LVIPDMARASVSELAAGHKSNALIAAISAPAASWPLLRASGRVLLEAAPEGIEDCHRIRRELEQILEERLAITHTTLQVDHARRELLSIRPLRSDRRDR
jgi:hypothetical protein